MWRQMPIGTLCENSQTPLGLTSSVTHCGHRALSNSNKVNDSRELYPQLGPGRYRLPLHRMPCSSKNDVSQRVSTKWRAEKICLVVKEEEGPCRYCRPCQRMQRELKSRGFKMRVDDVAAKICQALPAVHEVAHEDVVGIRHIPARLEQLQQVVELPVSRVADTAVFV
jgi:hypothetical protein